MAGTRGKQLAGEGGFKTYELEDAYRVLENIKNTPKYWKQVKYEMLAKLDDLGPFQLLFTLSCADMQGMKTSLPFSWNTEVEARKRNCGWKPIKMFIQEDVDESLHELVRGNVLGITNTD